MTHSKALALAALLSCAGWPATAADTLEATWLRLIKAGFDKSCAVEVLSVGSVVAGNNGLRSEQWFVQTCRGKFEYRVAYYPPSAFPDRTNPYEVTQVAPVSGARPNNSFKPKPLRGSDRRSGVSG
ncbi:hypothetical protein GCM10027431_32620 [Lysobacter rhizosphaerae]